MLLDDFLLRGVYDKAHGDADVAQWDEGIKQYEKLLAKMRQSGLETTDLAAVEKLGEYVDRQEAIFAELVTRSRESVVTKDRLEATAERLSAKITETRQEHQGDIAELREANARAVELALQPPDPACPQVYRVSVSYDVMPLQEEDYASTLVVAPHTRREQARSVQPGHPIPASETATAQLFYDGFRAGKRGAQRDAYFGRTLAGPASPTAAFVTTCSRPHVNAPRSSVANVTRKSGPMKASYSTTASRSGSGDRA